MTMRECKHCVFHKMILTLYLSLTHVVKRNFSPVRTPAQTDEYYGKGAHLASSWGCMLQFGTNLIMHVLI